MGSVWRYWLRRLCSPRGRVAASLSAGRSVLLVDLDGRAGAILAPPLARAGLGLRVVGESGAALEALHGPSPAAVIVSGQAPPGLYAALRRATPVPLLALDPRAGEETVLAAFAAGVDQFQAGPIGPEEVAARVLALLRRGVGV